MNRTKGATAFNSLTLWGAFAFMINLTTIMVASLRCDGNRIDHDGDPGDQE